MNLEKKRHRFYVQSTLALGKLVLDDPELAHQLGRVLKIKSGEEIILFSGNGKECVANFLSAEKSAVIVEIVSEHATPDAGLREVTVAVAMIRKERFEWMLEKLTELGVAAIVPLETSRTTRFPWKRLRFETIIKEAAEQSGRGTLPKLEEPQSLDKFLAAPFGGSTFICDRSATSSPSGKGSVRVLVGPEGGWSAEELAHFEDKKLKTLNLGPLTLKTETAAIIAASRLIS